MAANLVDIGRIIAYECGELDEGETIALFQDMIDAGTAWNLQGSYGRVAQHLIDAGYCQPARSVEQLTTEEVTL